jgi:MYXO-CTERM domain-containing protein
VTSTLLVTITALPANAEGKWTAAPLSASNGGPAFGLWLMTDGTVLSHGNALNHWVKLTPDKKGSYANGTWTTVASSAYARGGAQEHVLKDGRFFEAGGEYIYVYPGCASGCAQPPNGSPLFKNVEIYDPLTDTWTIQASGLYDIGDTGSATLGDGRILDSTRVSNATQIYDPSSNMWTAGPAHPNPNGDENAWAALQNGGVLAVAPKSAAVYNPATNTWVATGPLPAGLAVTLTAASGYPGTYDLGDVAGISLMFDGRVLVYGLGKTAIYTPGPTASDPGTWALGPDLPYKTGPNFGTAGNDAEDEYTVTEPNGKVMVASYPFGGKPDTLQEFDPATNTFTVITPPPDSSNPYPQSYLNLPDGEVLATCGSKDWLYTPDSPPQDAWRPTVTSVVYGGGTTYTLTGTQLSGLINGGDEGDDMTMAENYPIVWLTDSSGDVYFCRTFNFSYMMPSKGSMPETCQFTTPAGLPNGTYSLYVSAVGVPSKDPFSFTTGQSEDAGALADAGGPSDSGASGDGGGAGDAAAASDSGIKSDAGAVSDAGLPEGSGNGGPRETDGSGVVADSGMAAGGMDDASAASGTASAQGGCGCRTVRPRAPWYEGTIGIAALGALGFVRRRRRATR